MNNCFREKGCAGRFWPISRGSSSYSRFLVFSVLAFLFVNTVYSIKISDAQLSPACNMNCNRILETCQPLDAACHGRNAARAPQLAICNTRQRDCNAKLVLYKGYMANLNNGVTRYSLPARYRQILAPHYRNVNLGIVQFGYGPNQPENNATTDCTRIYFNRQSVVNEIRTGTMNSDSEIRWLLHELRHVGQCMQVGGRDAYAKMWFDHLTVGLMQDLDLATLHDRMIMESDAETVANRVFSRLAACCIDRNNNITPPIRILGMERSGGSLAVGNPLPVQLTLQTSGGSDPLEYAWTMRRPGSSAFVGIPSSEGRAEDNVFRWTPRQAGRYQVRTRVFQRESRLRPAARIFSYDVSAAPVLNLPVRKDPFRR